MGNSSLLRHALKHTLTAALSLVIIVPVSASAQDAESQANYYVPPDVANQNAAPIIIPPEAADNHFELGPNDALPELVVKSGQAVSLTLGDLKHNLAILHDLNSKPNQDALDELGERFDVPNLGTHFGAAVMALNASKSADAIDALAASVAAETSGFQGDIEELKRTSKNLPSLKSKLTDEQTAQFLPQAHAISTFMGKANDFLPFMRFDYELATLNANIVSANKTYVNLLAIARQTPSEQLAIGGLQGKLAAFDGLSGQFRNFSNFGEAFTTLNALLEEHENGAQAIANNKDLINAKTVSSSAHLNETIGAAVADIASQLANINVQLQAILGRPPVADFNIADIKDPELQDIFREAAKESKEVAEETKKRLAHPEQLGNETDNSSDASAPGAGEQTPDASQENAR